MLLARLIVGGTLLVAGALKIGHFDALASTMASYRIPFLAPSVIAPMSVAIPLIEVLLGAYLLIGLYTRLVGALALCEFAIFAAAVASVVMRGIAASCGCFGPSDTRPASWVEVARDVGLAILAALIVWRGPGAFALDQRINSES
ncbi:MAG TPA: MauE/DoxX family redox-associated membrane protein [Candidatus Acidoferrales bacterium]|nr:MauE/DoxX family redox-associated membrane protein [Candidatus Acidoferrales bacterium]